MGKFFCSMPFYHIYSSSNGKYAPCCLATESTRTVSDTTLKQWWNSDEMNQLRHAMLNDGDAAVVNHFCSICKKQEAEKGKSFRTDHNERFKDTRVEDSRGLHNAIEEFKSEYEIDLEYIQERFLELKLRLFGNKCNLSCFMCFPKDSNRRVKEVSGFNEEIQKDFFLDKITDSNISLDETIKQILEVADNISYIKIIGGEPFVQKGYEKLLDALVESGHSRHIIVKFQSNLSVNLQIEDYLGKFKGFHVSGSIDGYGLDNDYLRHGSDWDKIDNNLNKLLSLGVSVSVSSTITFLSILRFDALVEYIKGLRISHDRYVLDTPDFLSIKHLPEPLKDRMRFMFKDYSDIINILNQQRDEKAFQKALKYCLELKRDRDLFDVYPELKEYYETNSGGTNI